MSDAFTPSERASGHLTPRFSWKRYEQPHPPFEFGAWAITHRLHSGGSDYTAPHSNMGIPSPSFIKRIWNGRLNPLDAFDGTHIWTVEDDQTGRPVGVVVWERSNDALGRINIWMSPAFRARGLMGLLLDNEVVPAIERAARELPEDAKPLLAGDATLHMLRSRTWVNVDELVVWSSDLPSPNPERKRVRM